MLLYIITPCWQIAEKFLACKLSRKSGLPMIHAPFKYNRLQLNSAPPPDENGTVHTCDTLRAHG